MADRVIAYYDGSNFYHLALDNYGLTGFDFSMVTHALLRSNEKLLKIKFFTAPVNRQEDAYAYSEQQKFFSCISKNPMIELKLGKLVTRNLRQVWVSCPHCHITAISTDANCSKCGWTIDLTNVKRTIEKGVDVNLAITMMLDAINNEFDTAFLMSSDADFKPVIEYIINTLHKKVVYCHFPNPFTGDLITACNKNTILIKKEILEQNRA
jgi:uncharacterized LabA/DUF88 family protein